MVVVLLVVVLGPLPFLRRRCRRRCLPAGTGLSRGVLLRSFQSTFSSSFPNPLVPSFHRALNLSSFCP